jgi:hypothetical protein
MSVPSPAVPAQPTPTTPSRKPPATARSIGFTPSSATDNDWRQSPSSTPTTANGINAKGPGKTIGGFEKKSMKDLKDDKKDKDKEDKDKSKLLLSLDHQGKSSYSSQSCSCSLSILQARCLYCWRQLSFLTLDARA